MEPPDKKLKRRVPDSERQRSSTSCDRCKTRKIRCIRLADASSSRNDSGAACAACAQLQLPCNTTLPRKQRVYVSYDQLKLRYRALDLLVRRMCPGEGVESEEEIRALAERRGLDMSDLDTRGGLDPLIGEQEEQGLNGREGGNMYDMYTSGGSGSSNNHTRATSERPTVPRHTDALSESIQLLTIPEGALIPAPRGGFHYVGPASSYLFANTIRELVKKSDAHTFAIDRQSQRRKERAQAFTSHDRQTALEAREEGHPVMAAATDETSPMSIHNNGNGPSPLQQLTPGISNAALLANDMPQRSLANKLVNAFFERVHPDFSLFHRSTFQVRYEAMWSAVQDTDPGWLCTLYMVFVLGAQALERDGVPEAVPTQSRYLALVVREGLQRLVLTASLLNTQALALLGLYQHNAGERNTAWLLMGHAARMAVSLGMQRDGEHEHAQFDFIVRNNRRIVWWTLYLYEQNLSFTLGRPSATTTLDMSALLPDDAVLDHSVAPPGYLAHAVKLGGISAKVKRFIASISPDYDKPDRLAQTTELATQIDQLLLEWHAALPPHLGSMAVFPTPKHARTTLLLQAMYNHLRSTIGRPYLLCKVNQQLGGYPTASAIATLAASAVDAARTCMQVMLQLANTHGLEGELWYDFYYVHHASLVLSLPLLASADSPDRGIISNALNYAQQSRLSPTYRILINVSLQFAKIVGIGPADDPSRPASPNGMSGMPPPPFGYNDPTWTLPPAQNQSLTLEQLLGLSPMPQPQGTSDMLNFGQTWGAEMGDVPWDFFSGMGQ